MDSAIIDLELKTDGFSIKTQGGISLKGHAGVVTSEGKNSVAELSLDDNNSNHQMAVKKINENAVELVQHLKCKEMNVSSIEKINMSEFKMEFPGKGWRVIHGELFKKEVYCDGCSFFTGGLFSPLEKTEGEFGLSEDFPFPGIFFTHPEWGTLLIAVLSQEKCKPVFNLSTKDGITTLNCSEAILGVSSIELNGKEDFSTENWVVISVEGNFEEAIDKYFEILKSRIEFKGTDSILRNAIVWGSWNYNDRPRGRGDVEHGWLVDNAKKLVEIVPEDKAKFVMIDDGYQPGRSKEQCDKDWYAYGIDIFYPEGDIEYDPALFPKGMKAVADDISSTGAKPAIWITPRLHKESKLVKEHPEWMLEMEEGTGFMGRTAFLDYSVPEAREYTRKAWDTIFNKWGFKAVKVDFWSMAFEIPQLRFKNTDKTAVELRNLFIKDLSEFIPDDGYFLTCCVTNSGNPFLGKYAAASRSGFDISGGDWKGVQQSSSVLTSSMLFYRHDCLIADADSIGWNEKNTPGQNRVWATVAMFTGAMFEIGGDLNKLSDESKKLFETVIKFSGPSIKTSIDISSGLLNNFPASRLVLERPDGIYEAHINWLDIPREIKNPDGVTDLWSGEKLPDKYKLSGYDAVIFKR